MDPRDLNALGLAPAASAVVGRYLAALDAALPVGRRARRAILTEIADGLACAIADAGRRGLAPSDAARAAVTDSGDPDTVARAFSRQLGPAVAHRLGLGLVLTGPAVGVAWLAAYTAGGQGWAARIGAVLAAVPQYPLILAVTVPAAVVATVGAGRVARHLTVAPRRVTGAALVAAIGCVTGDLSLLTAAIAGPHRLTGLVGLAAAASLLRLMVVGPAGRRIARLRAAGR